MTMPHLMNCLHSDAGWCLACVKEMHDEYERILEDLRDDYSEAMAICYAAEEFAAGRIDHEEFIDTVNDFNQGDDK